MVSCDFVFYVHFLQFLENLGKFNCVFFVVNDIFWGTFTRFFRGNCILA